MASVLVQVADAVTAELNDATNAWSQPFTATRSYGNWDLTPEGLKEELRADVIGLANLASDLETRGSAEYLVQVAVFLRKKFKGGDSDAETGRIELDVTDGLVALMEEINEHFMTLRLPEFEDAIWRDGKITPVDIAHMNNPRQFTGKLVMTFAVSKDL